MDENNNRSIELGYPIIWMIIGFMIARFFGAGQYEGLKAKDWYNKYNARVQMTEDYKVALQRANSNIRKANYFIENAKYNSWLTYDEMGIALDSLDTIETVEDPW